MTDKPSIGRILWEVGVFMAAIGAVIVVVTFLGGHRITDEEASCYASAGSYVAGECRK